MKKILLIGNFCFGEESHNGQTSKSRDYYHYLAEKYGAENIVTLDTAHWRKKIITSYLSLLKLLKNTENVVMLLGVNAAKYILPVVTKLKKKHKYRVLWPIVGGSLLYDGGAQKKLLPMFGKIDAIFFETKKMAEFFSDKGTKVYYAPVFTKRVLSEKFEPEINNGVLKLCTYSRVCKEKGITSAVEAVKNINKEAVLCTLDIFGPPYEDYKNEFDEITEGTESYIFKNDYLNGEGVINKLAEFDAMLFPTYYPGEGFPIGVVECLTGGVPVIASDWHYNSEIIQHGKTGFIFDLNDKSELENCIRQLLDNRGLLLEMKKNAREYSEFFKPNSVLKDLFAEIDEKGE